MPANCPNCGDYRMTFPCSCGWGGPHPATSLTEPPPPDPRDAELTRLRRELADAADQIEAMSKEWACPGWDCVGGRMHPRDKFSRAATATATDCPHHAHAREHVEAARRAAGDSTSEKDAT